LPGPGGTENFDSPERGQLQSLFQGFTQPPSP
jgi:hypothetical protein